MPSNNKQPCLCLTSLRNLLFHLVQCVCLHFKSPDLYLSCTMKVFPKFLLPFQCQASSQSEQFGSYGYAPRSLSLVACSFSSQQSFMLMQKRPLLGLITYLSSCFSALVEAKEKYTEWRIEQENKAEQDLQKMSKKPAPYKHIRVSLSYAIFCLAVRLL